MPGDKFSAVWVSHSSMGDFLKCPKAYYLNNVYKDPKTGNKISLMQPALALGQAVHEVLESLSVVPTQERFNTPLLDLYDKSWDKISGKKGGFLDKDTESHYKFRGVEMLKRVQNHPGPLARKAVKIRADLPHYWLSSDDGIILCGKIDWLEYLPAQDAVHIVDFKTGKNREDNESLKLPIYHLLVHNCQQRDVVKASYWYLHDSDEIEEVELPNLEEAKQRVLKVAKQVKLARQLHKFDCVNGDECWACRDLQAIVRGDAEYVGQNDFKQDIYILPSKGDELPQSDIL